MMANAGNRILTPTIIEEVNFKVWKDEAFSIWKEWSRVYPPKGQTQKLLASVAEWRCGGEARSRRYVVNRVIGGD